MKYTVVGFHISSTLIIVYHGVIISDLPTSEAILFGEFFKVFGLQAFSLAFLFS